MSSAIGLYVRQGFFLAPQMVGEARKGGYLTAQVLAKEGFTVRPPTGDVVTAVALGSRGRLLVRVITRFLTYQREVEGGLRRAASHRRRRHRRGAGLTRPPAGKSHNTISNVSEGG
jgi:hypothetical protein